MACWQCWAVPGSGPTFKELTGSWGRDVELLLSSGVAGYAYCTQAFRKDVRSLKVNMLPAPPFTIAVGPHFPSGSQDAVSDLLYVCSSKALGNMPCGNPGRGREDVDPYITFGAPHSKEQFDTLE